MFSQVAQGDVSVERDTYKQSRQGLDEMYNEARRQLKEECQLRQVSTALPPSAPNSSADATLGGGVMLIYALIVRMWRTSWLLRCR